MSKPFWRLPALLAAFALENIGRQAENSVPALIKSLRGKNADVRCSAHQPKASS